MKHDHKKTKKLKVALFAMIMFLPFIAIGITCATHIFNKEVAEETETAEIVYQYTTNNPQEEIIYNNKYLLNGTITYNEIVHNDDATFQGDIEIISGTINLNNSWNIQQVENAAIYIYQNINTPRIIINFDFEVMTFNYILGEDAYLQYSNNFQTYSNTITFNNCIVRVNNFGQSTYNGLIEMLQELPQEINPIQNVNITTNPTDQTTNIFYDSCDQVQDSFILNWCTNGNPIRNGINAFTNAFNLPNDHIINTLLTYWLCISMIYIVIDIIIECIVYITHFFNKEI